MDILLEMSCDEGGNMLVHGFDFCVDVVCRRVKGRQQHMNIDHVIIDDKLAEAGHGRINFVKTAFIPVPQISNFQVSL